MSTAFSDRVIDRVEAAEACREGIELSAQDVSDLIDGFLDESVVMEEWIAKLAAVDVKGLRISRKAQQALAAALGLDVEDVWS